MANLFDKLNPELKKTLEDNAKKYPISVSNVIHSLKSNVIHSDLTIGELRELAIMSDTNMDNFDWKFGKNIYYK
tara:strand:- start:213 stop:434 length:222 start_codon:yes stop_codon:yes gene_type:complete